MRLSTGHRKWIYWSGAALFATGALWLLFHYFLHRHGEFGEAAHPLEIWWLRLHGACAMLVLLVLGSLLPIHVRRGWHQRKNLWAGGIVSAVALLLIASGYALYYYGGEEARPWISAFHWVLGLGTPVLLVWHIWRGRQLHSHAAQLRPAPESDPGQRRSDPSRTIPAEAYPPRQASRPSISA
jgi:hypothetical protein